MPTLDGYIHADTPHERTVQPAGYRYGCHSAERGGANPRGGQTRHVAHPWSANAVRLVVTDWLPMPCGHNTRATDPACIGCANNA